MFILRPAISLHDREGLVTVENNGKGTVEAAIRKGELDFIRLRSLLDQGFTDRADDPSREHACAIAILKKFPGLFVKCRSERERIIHAAVRSDLDVFRTLFLTDRPFGRIEEIVTDFAEHDGRFRVWFAADPKRFPHFLQMLETIPYLQVETGKRNGRYDAAVVESTDIANRRDARNAGERVLFIDMTRSRLEVGPLIITDRFFMPEPAEVMPDSPQDGPGDAALLYFFSRRILFAVLFGLEEDLSENVGLPFRSRLIIDRVSLEGHAETVAVKPILKEQGQEQEMNQPALR